MEYQKIANLLESTSVRQYFGYILWSLRKKISSKNFALVVTQILRLFVNILTLDEKYSLSVKASV